MNERLRLDQHTDDTIDALYDQRDKLIRWHAEDGEQLTEMRGTIERLRAELDRSRDIAVALENELAAAEAANARFRERVQAAADEARGSMRDWLLDALSGSPDPRVPGTGRARAEAELERLRGRLGTALACVRLLRIYADRLDHGRQVDASDVAHRIRRILTGLDDRPTGDPEPQLIPELERAEAKVAEYENAITWHTDCLSCARVLDSCIRETNRAERAEAELVRLTEAESADAAAGSYAHRAEHAEAERDQHAATVQRALAECDRIAQLPAVAEDSGRADTFDTGARWTLRMIQTALTGSCPGCAVPGCGCAGAAQPDTALCRCGHTRNQHQDNTGLGGVQCRVCPGDEERSWRHPYTPTEGSAR